MVVVVVVVVVIDRDCPNGSAVCTVGVIGKATNNFNGKEVFLESHYY